MCGLVIEFNGYESARRKGAMSSKEIESNWDSVFGKRLTWLQLKKIKESWSK